MDLDDLIAVDRRHHAERVLAEVATGAIDFCQLRVRLLKRGGDELDVEAWIGALNAAPPVVGAVLAAVPRPDRYRPGETRLLRPDGHHVVLGTVGPDLRFTELSAGAPELFGRDSQRLRGECLADAVHPADVAELLLAVGRSAAERGAVTARLRFGHSDGWVAVRCTISPVGGRVARFYVVMTMLPPTDEVEPPGDRLRRLEGHLSRIASEVQAAGVRSPVRDPVLTEAARRGLTARQTDVLRRVVHGVARGEPTSDIASQLLVSESTVRNHLAAVCRKFGVRSKSQLLAHLAALAQEPAS
jgi:DNA-binding CsgD family transcriptional regulator